MATDRRALPLGAHGASKYTPELADEIVCRLSSGETMAQICRDEHMPSVSTVLDWQGVDAEFARRVARAREAGYDEIAQDALQIADNGFNDKSVDDDGHQVVNHDVIQRSKLRVETRLKLLACWDPRRYGTQRVEANVEMHAPKSDQVMTEIASLLAKVNSQL